MRERGTEPFQDGPVPGRPLRLFPPALLQKGLSVSFFICLGFKFQLLELHQFLQDKSAAGARSRAKTATAAVVGTPRECAGRRSQPGKVGAERAHTAALSPGSGAGGPSGPTRRRHEADGPRVSGLHLPTAPPTSILLFERLKCVEMI